ncbi:MAG: hypothetical protein QOD84_2806 [Acidobacteriaceae bacterium]|jgi:hypothetical protein
MIVEYGTMTIESAFFDLMITSWFFLAGWVLVIIVASGIAFGDDLS